MSKYSENNMLKIAKRYNNKKRTYLLVNPLQAKHLAVSPTDSLDMMQTFGKMLARKYPDTKLVIGFAETATAIGAVVAGCISDECIYIHTTREKDEEVSEWIFFEEEHSHAVNQLLCAEHLFEWVNDTKTVLFIEDEVSTGKTMLNIIAELKKVFPILKEKELIVASLLNRVSGENEARLVDAGIKCEYLVKLASEGYEEKVQQIHVKEAEQINSGKESFSHRTLNVEGLNSMNQGMPIQKYIKKCDLLKTAVLQEFESKKGLVDKILVLGTEECMFPALYIGKGLEESGFIVFCHATTRSPIGLNEEEKYPIKNGKKITSFYKNDRDTYVYDLQKYDAVIVISDTKNKDLKAMNDVVSAFRPLGCNSFYFVQGGQNVWYI